MTKLRFEKKLRLRKLTVAHLNGQEMRGVRGGCIPSSTIPLLCKEIIDQGSDNSCLPGCFLGSI